MYSEGLFQYRMQGRHQKGKRLYVGIITETKKLSVEYGATIFLQL